MTVEDRIKQRLAERFRALADAGRCTFAREVWLLSWGHIAHGAKRIRADFVLSLDDSPLIAVEVKGRFEQPSDLGRALSQSDDYARAQVAPAVHVAGSLPPHWMGLPIRLAALAADLPGSRDVVRAHAEMAHRIVGCRNVGFFEAEQRGLCFRLGGERWWSEWNGWRADAFARGVRVGACRMDAP